MCPVPGNWRGYLPRGYRALPHRAACGRSNRTRFPQRPDPFQQHAVAGKSEVILEFLDGFDDPHSDVSVHEQAVLLKLMFVEVLLWEQDRWTGRTEGGCSSIFPAADGLLVKERFLEAVGIQHGPASHQQRES